MFDVFAIKIVRSIKLRPVAGSINSGNSFRTAVISFPRSPQPIYTIISASHHLAIACWVMVFPVPNPPGMATVPPFASGKSVSIIRCPVIKGISSGSRFLVGRGLRIGQCCIKSRFSSFPFSVSNIPMLWSTVKSPSEIAVIVPDNEPGIKILCSMRSVSFTVPIIVPLST